MPGALASVDMADSSARVQPLRLLLPDQLKKVWIWLESVQAGWIIKRCGAIMQRLYLAGTVLAPDDSMALYHINPSKRVVRVLQNAGCAIGRTGPTEN